MYLFLQNNSVAVYKFAQEQFQCIPRRLHETSRRSVVRKMYKISPLKTSITFA